MQPRLALSLVLLVALLAGCNDPAPVPEPTPAAPPPALPHYAFQVVVTEERPDGPRLPAEVHATRLDQGRLAAPILRSTDGSGVARFVLFEPGTYLVRVLGPTGWTQEGARILLDETGLQLEGTEGLVVSDGDLFVPLYRSSLDFVGQQTWSTTLASVGSDGSVAPAFMGLPLPLPEGLEAAYRSRLTQGQVTVRWSDSVDGLAPSLAAGLVVGDALVAEGEPVPASFVPGEREAAWAGDDLEAVRASAEPVLAAAVTRSAVLGMVLLDFQATLEFGGQVPPELPPLNCHLRYGVCGVPLPPLPPGPPLA